MKMFSGSYTKNLAMVNEALRTDESFDIVTKRLRIADKRAVMYCIDGFIKDDVLEKMMEYLTKITPEEMSNTRDADAFLDSYITYIEGSTVDNLERFLTFILSGAVGMFVEGFTKAIIIDSRTYPARSVEEPEADKVLRGAHEGFVETVIFNTAMIRRKIRSTDLTMKSFQIGEKSKTDVIVCYLEDKVDRKRLNIILDKLNTIKVDSLSMSQESLKECLVPGQHWNPFPKIRYTERPDAAAACIYDGNIIILVDGSPSAMILPTGIFDFIQDINDYYFPPLLGMLLRGVRVAVFTLSMVFVPMWYLLILNHENLPDALKFMLIEDSYTVPIFVQLLIVEFVIDTLRLASLNTPSALSSSFSVVGALVLGEFAVRSGWFVSEVVLFMAFVAIANFTQPSYELGYAIKIGRTLLLVLAAFFDWWGFFAGLIIIAAVISVTKTPFGYTYLYPLVPFDRKALKSLVIRSGIKVEYKK